MELKTTNYPRIGVGVLVVRNGQFLLGKRIGNHMPGYYAAPGGHLEHGETFAQCATREVLEETGLELTNVQLLTIGNYMFGNTHYVDIDMVGEAIFGEAQVLEPLKCADWQWYNADNLPSPLFIVTSRMINTYFNKHNYVENIAEEILVQEAIIQNESTKRSLT